MTSRNPQAEQMAHESMLRTLAAQAEALWPLEAPLFDRYGAPRDVLDVGCGTGQVTDRLAERFPHARVLGVDVHPPHLDRARAAHRRDNLSFAPGDAFALAHPDAAFDLVVCRHVVQSLPTPWLALAELRRVLRPGGHVHVLAEDYGMMQFDPSPRDADRLWRDGVWAFAASLDNDARIGRKLGRHLTDVGFHEPRVDYLVCDTQRVDRATFARIWEAWRDGYAAPIAAATALSLDETTAHFDEMIAAILTGYAVWHVPIWSARR